MTAYSSHTSNFQAVVLAAGRGSRMGSDLPKVLLPLCSRPMITYILDALKTLRIAHPVVVISKAGEVVRETLGGEYIYAVQEDQLGSGHAVMSARETASGSQQVLVLCGDSPLFRMETIESLMEEHLNNKATMTLVSAILDNPTGYGRILRGPGGDIVGIVEEKMATDEQKAVREINGGCYAFDADWLWQNLAAMRRNEAGEYCLTEMVDIAIAQGKKVIAVPADPDEVAGINTPAQLQEAEEIIRSRI